MQSVVDRKLQYQTVRDKASRYGLDRNGIRNILGISESTQFRYEKHNPVLKPHQIDRWARFSRIAEQAFDLFEDETETKRWLSTPKNYLEGRTPIEALTTDAGSIQVEQMLYRAAYGIFA
ncbi:MAG: antitoxin Xre/MbcA/ParS toxin-binding domain-containing protein [Xenococcaceae cyanobacterium]